MGLKDSVYQMLQPFNQILVSVIWRGLGGFNGVNTNKANNGNMKEKQPGGAFSGTCISNLEAVSVLWPHVLLKTTFVARDEAEA